MRVGADGMYMRFQRTGLGHFQDGLLHALAAELGTSDELFVYYNSLPAPPLFQAPVRERFVRMPRPLAWNQLGVPAALALDRCDVYLGSANIVPALGREPKVLHVHDCLPFSNPDAHPGSRGRYLRRWMKASAKRAARLTANSRWAAEQAERYLGLRASDFVVVPPGVDARFGPEPAGVDEEQRVRALVGSSSPYVLHVGAFEAHKGGDELVAAVNNLRAEGRDVTLVRCGGPGPQRAADDAVDLGYVDDAILPALYRQATVVVVPSRAEGFGMPAIEAMASGAPIVASRAGALPETTGEAALLVDLGDISGLAAAIGRLLDRGEEWSRLRAAGLARARGYTWASAPKLMLGVLREAAEAGDNEARRVDPAQP